MEIISLGNNQFKNSEIISELNKTQEELAEEIENQIRIIRMGYEIISQFPIKIAYRIILQAKHKSNYQNK